MPRIEKGTLINARAKKVFSLLTNFHRWPEIFPNIIEVPEITEKEGKTCIKWVYKMMGIRIKGEALIIESVPNQRLIIEIKMLAHIHWIWMLEEKQNITQVTSTVEYEIPSWGPVKIAKSLSTEQQFERELVTTLNTIKQIVESKSE